MTAIASNAKTVKKAKALLESWGWPVTLYSGWEDRSNSSRPIYEWSGITVHHTGGHTTATSYMVRPSDRPQLGVLCNAHITRGHKIVITAAGAASHAGYGDHGNYKKMAANKAPLSGNMSPGPDSNFSANRYTFGIEVDGDGRADEWDDWMHGAVVALCAALHKASGWPSDHSPRLMAHKEFTRRKPGDPRMNVGTLRKEVQAFLKKPYGPNQKPVPTTDYKLGDRILSKNGNDYGSDVKQLIDALNKHGYKLKNDASFGPAVEAAVKDYQTKNKLSVDGKVGPETVTSLLNDKRPEPQPEQPEIPDPVIPPVVDPEPEPEPEKPTTAIIIIAGSANTTDGKLHSKYKRRLDVALDLLNKNKTQKIIVTGGVKAGRGSSSEAANARAYLIYNGIAAGRILSEGKSGSTNGNFMYGLPIADKAGAKSIVVVSDFSHMRRCLAFAYAANKAKKLDIPISGVAYYKDGTTQDATVSQATMQAKVAWSGITTDIVQDLDGRWGIAQFPTIRKGDSGAVVRRAQKALGVTVDGKFGPDTEKAVKKFQTSKNLDNDGIIGPKTWKELV